MNHPSTVSTVFPSPHSQLRMSLLTRFVPNTSGAIRLRRFVAAALSRGSGSYRIWRRAFTLTLNGSNEFSIAFNAVRRVVTRRLLFVASSNKANEPSSPRLASARVAASARLGCPTSDTSAARIVWCRGISPWVIFVASARPAFRPWRCERQGRYPGGIYLLGVIPGPHRDGGGAQRTIRHRTTPCSGREPAVRVNYNSGAFGGWPDATHRVRYHPS
jgi:hypothetical protein